MHPHSGENMPPASVEAPSLPASNSSEVVPAQSAEMGLIEAREGVSQAEKAGEDKVGKQQPATTQPPVDPTQQTQPALPAPADNQQPQTAQPPLVTQNLQATDVDLIEKGWVNSTKKVVSQTKDDPHKQKHEVARIKVDYLKKRFNKVLPVEDAT